MSINSLGGRLVRRGNRLVRTIIVLVCLGAFALATYITVQTFGRVEGIEFSPDTFASRTFVYYEIPLIRARVSGVDREDISSGLQRNVTSSNLIAKSTVDPPRWHLVAMTKGSVYYQDDALIVYQYLRTNGNALVTPTLTLGDSPAAEFWAEWTRKHDKLAKIFWPAVADVCRQDLYTFAPALFNQAEQMTAAESKPSVEEFQQALDEVLAEQYTELGDVRRGQGAHDEAIEYYAAALDHVADYRAALSGREQSYYNTDQTDKSKADRQRLRELQQ